MIGSFVPRLTRKVFQKHGFASAALLTEWPAIVGPELAAYTQPERLRWPHAQTSNGGGTTEPSSRRRGALVLRVDGARALDVQYKGALILERINRHFGYRAVHELRIVQAPLAATESYPAPQRRRIMTERGARAPTPPPIPELAAVRDEELRSALHRLQVGVLGAEK